MATLNGALAVALTAVMALPGAAIAWNIPGHMLSGSITYQILSHEDPSTIVKVRAILEKHPWYAVRWREQLETFPIAERDEIFFMLAPRWPDDVRTQDQAQDRPPWHYISIPFKPPGQPESVRTRPPAPANILTASAEQERIAKTGRNADKRAVALAWLMHLVGDLHQPLHTAQRFTTAYPNGDRGGNDVCIRLSPTGKPTRLHLFWDEVAKTDASITQLKNKATALRSRPEFSRSRLTELASGDFASWAGESFTIATKIAYQNGASLGTPKGSRLDCSEVADAAILPSKYVQITRRIRERRIILAGYRLAEVLKRITR